jgi:hypothetical protein
MTSTLLIIFLSLSTKEEITDAFGNFHTDIIDNYSGINDINASYYLIIFIGRTPVQVHCFGPDA